MRGSPRSTPTSDSLRQVLTPNPYSSSTHLPTYATLISTHMHLLYKVSVYFRATKQKVPPLPLNEEIRKMQRRRQERLLKMRIARKKASIYIFELEISSNLSLKFIMIYICDSESFLQNSVTTKFKIELHMASYT